MEPTEITKKVSETQKQVLGGIKNQHKSALRRYPLLFTFLAAFGGAAVLDGFTRLIVKIPLIDRNPVLTLVTGVIVLAITGTLYKRL